MQDLQLQITAYNIDIAAVQETRWTGQQIWDTKDYTIFSSGRQKQKGGGMAFIIRKTLKSGILGFEPVNNRMCIIRIKTLFFNISLI